MQQRYQSREDEPDTQQERAEILWQFHWRTPFGEQLSVFAGKYG
jgi:hypothetical protein